MPPKKSSKSEAAPATKGRAQRANIPDGSRVRVNVTISGEQEAALLEKAQAAGMRGLTTYVYSLIAKDLQATA